MSEYLNCDAERPRLSLNRLDIISERGSKGECVYIRVKVNAFIVKERFCLLFLCVEFEDKGFLHLWIEDGGMRRGGCREDEPVIS